MNARWLCAGSSRATAGEILGLSRWSPPSYGSKAPRGEWTTFQKGPSTRSMKRSAAALDQQKSTPTDNEEIPTDDDNVEKEDTGSAAADDRDSGDLTKDYEFFPVEGDGSSPFESSGLPLFRHLKIWLNEWRLSDQWGQEAVSDESFWKGIRMAMEEVHYAVGKNDIEPIRDSLSPLLYKDLAKFTEQLSNDDMTVTATIADFRDEKIVDLTNKGTREAQEMKLYAVITAMASVRMTFAVKKNGRVIREEDCWDRQLFRLRTLTGVVGFTRPSSRENEVSIHLPQAPDWQLESFVLGGLARPLPAE